MGEELSDEVVEQIVFGMENQEEDFYFDREKKRLVTPEEIAQEEEFGPQEESAGERYIPLPEWRPVDGFHLMEEFVTVVKNPVYREELKEALGGGKGVFRRFKDLIKKYEPLERQWYNFKEREMRRIVRRWFSGILESEEFARLGEEPTETEQLLLSDLDVRVDKESLETRKEKIEKSVSEAMSDISEELQEVKFAELISLCSTTEGYTVEAALPSGEVVGSVGGELFTAGGGDVFRVFYLYVEQEYRGMGISRLLLDRITDTSKNVEAKELIMDIPTGSSFLEREIHERGFAEFVKSYRLRWSRFD